MLKKKLCIILTAILALFTMVGNKLNAYAAVSIVGSWHICGMGDNVDFTEGTFTTVDLPEGMTEDYATFTVYSDGTGVMNITGELENARISFHDGEFFLPAEPGEEPEGLPYLEHPNGEIYICDLSAVWVKDGGPITPLPEELEQGHTHDFQWKTISEPTAEKDGLEAEVCSICGERRNEQPLSAYGYALNQYAAPVIEAAQPGQTTTLEFGEWNSFPKSFMDKVAAKNDVTYVFKFKYNHQRYTICIPAGIKVDYNEDWFGPLKLAELFGAIIE